MPKNDLYSLPDLPFGYNALLPYISEEQLRIHHQKHHQAYVISCNAILEKLDKAREARADADMKSILKEFSFNLGGHILHSLFWNNLTPAESVSEPRGDFAEKINDEFGSFDRFKKEFSQAALSCEGSGWAALILDKISQRLLLMQIEKHNLNVYPGNPVLMVLDVFEHAYYIDYKNERAGFIEAFWNIVNWKEVEKRLAMQQGSF